MSKKLQPLGGREKSLWQAAAAAMLLHVLVLGALDRWGRLPAEESTPFAEVGLVEYQEEETRTMQEAVRARVEAKLGAVRNVGADARAERSDDLRTSSMSEAQLAEEVEAELRAFEQASFDALSQGRGSTSGAPSSRGDAKSPLERYDHWDARFDGQVTAEFDLEGRRAMALDIPGYRCRGAGVVTLSIVVSPGGEVLDAQAVSVDAGPGTEWSECLRSESVKAARQCRFSSRSDAPRRQNGTLTYRFIAQ